MIVPFCHVKHNHFRMLSLYGGGFGGWTHAMSHLVGFHAVPAQTVMIESDLLACIGYSVSHGVPIINGYSKLPVNLMHKVFTGCAIHANAVSDTWIEAIAAWHPNLITVSAPCRPWSAASESKGLAGQEGVLLPETMFQCRLLQPSYVGLEQVSGFQLHPHKRFVLKTIYMTGFTLLWSQCLDLSHFGPVHRSRWLALLKRVDGIPPCDMIPMHVPDLPDHTPKTFQALFPIRQWFGFQA